MKMSVWCGLAVLSGAVMLQGCAGVPPVQQPAVASANANAKVCTDARRLGSHVYTRTCKTAARIAQEKVFFGMAAPPPSPMNRAPVVGVR